jgi:hypothetical protein
LLGGRAVHGLVEPVPQLAVLVAQGGDLLQELLAGGARAVGVGQGLLDLVGVVVGALARAAGGAGLLGDVAVSAAQDGGGVADPGEQG